jgi:hypothetical protein
MHGRTIIESREDGKFTVTRQNNVNGWFQVDQFVTDDLTQPAPSLVRGKKSKRKLEPRRWFVPFASLSPVEEVSAA